MFRHTDPKVASSLKKRSNRTKAGPGRQSKNVEKKPAKLIAGTSSSSASTRAVSSPLPSTTEEWTQRALCFFFWTHTSPNFDPTGGSGWLDFLEDYVSSETRAPFLLDAIHAIAFSNLAHRVPMLSWMPTKALKHRTQALRGLQEALRDTEEAKKDDVLIALFLVERAEVSHLIIHI